MPIQANLVSTTRRSPPTIWLALIVLVYGITAALFAVFTPAWQAPDEPAHYNYVRFLATHASFPVLQPGDYDQAAQAQIIADKFPPGVSIEAFRYEFHQPPLYYAFAAIVFRLTDGNLLALRLFSVALGGLALIFVFAASSMVLRSWAALAATAFVAFLPMHVAMLASVNNDALAELLIAIMLWLCLRLLHAPAQNRFWLWLGIVLGLGFLTKSTVYSATLMIAATWLSCISAERRGKHALVSALLVAVPAFLIALPWWARNLSVYGGFDFLGLQRHDAIVHGQLRTAQFVAENGWGALVERFFTWTFRSFWGQFGWMSVLLDTRIYTALLAASMAVLVGGFATLFRVVTQGDFLQRRAVLMLAAMTLGAFGGYAWYNLSFVQHQGRYLFSALPALVIFAAAGAVALRQPLVSRASSILLALIFLASLLFGAERWTQALFAGAALIIFALPRFAHSPKLLFLGVVSAFVMLDLLSLFGFIVPQLRG